MVKLNKEYKPLPCKVKLGVYWNVDASGDITPTIHNPYNYYVPKSNLTGINWIGYLIKKGVSTEVLAEFYLAYIQALKNVGYKEVKLDLADPYMIYGI